MTQQHKFSFRSLPNLIGISIVVLLIISLVFGYFYMKAPALKADKAVPVDAVVFVQFTDFQSLYESIYIENNQVWKSVAEVEPLDYIDTTIMAMARSFYGNPDLQEAFANKPFIISLHPCGDKDYSLLLSLELPGAHYEGNVQKIIKNYLGDGALRSVKEFHDESIYEIQLSTTDGKKFFYAVKDGVFIAATDTRIVEKAIKRLELNQSIFELPSFKEISRSAGQKVLANIYVQYDCLGDFATKLFHTDHPAYGNLFKEFATISELDLTLKKEKCYLNGFTISEKKQRLAAFADGQASYSKAGEILPIQTGCFYQYAIHNPDTLVRRLMAVDSNVQQNLLPFIRLLNQEIIIAQVIDETFLFAGTQDVESAIAALQTMVSSSGNKEEYRGFPIYSYTSKELLSLLPSMSLFQPKYFTTFDDYLVFSESMQSIKAYIKTLSQGESLNNSPEFIRLSEDLSWKSDITFWCSFKSSLKVFENFLSEPLYQWSLSAFENLQKLNGFAIQFTRSDELFYTSAVIQFYNAGKTEEPVMYEVFREETQDDEPEIIPSTSAESQSFSGKPSSEKADWTLALNAPLIGKPSFIYDHRAAEKKMIAFDDQKNMYLISPKGRIIWTIALKELPISNVHEVDYYKNGKIQYLFNTSNYLYLIDLEGNNVANYPARLPVEAAGPIAVFDYNKTHEYRIFWAGVNNKVYCFDKQAKPQAGWRIPVLESKIVNPIQSLAKGNNTYIVLPMENGDVWLTTRTGTLRMKIEKSFTNALGSDFYINQTNSKGLLLTTDTKGSVIYIPASGPVKRTRFETFSPEHFFLYEDFTGNGSRDFIFLDKNRLVVYNRFKKKLLDHTFSSNPGIKPEIFSTDGGKKILGVVCPEEYRIYLFDKDGLLKNQQFKGQLPFSADRIRKSASLHAMITGSGSDFIYQVVP